LKKTAGHPTRSRSADWFALCKAPILPVGSLIIAPAIQRRSVADRKLRHKAEPNEPLNDNALQLVVAKRIELTGRADLTALDPLAGQHAFSLIAETAALNCPLSIARTRACSASSIRLSAVTIFFAASRPLSSSGRA
jgi:hypothetical protein